MKRIISLFLILFLSIQLVMAGYCNCSCGMISYTYFTSNNDCYNPTSGAAYFEISLEVWGEHYSFASAYLSNQEAAGYCAVFDSGGGNC